MFNELRQLAGLMGQLPKIKEEVQKMQERLGRLSAEGDAGGGMVKVRVNGRLEVLACELTDDALKLNDREMLEDLIRSATNQALERARALAAEEAGKLATGLGDRPAWGFRD